MTKTLQKAIMRRSQSKTMYLKSKTKEKLKIYKKQKNKYFKIYKKEIKQYNKTLDVKGSNR